MSEQAAASSSTAAQAVTADAGAQGAAEAQTEAVQKPDSALDSKLGSKFAALTRKEKETKAYEAKVKQYESQLKEREAAIAKRDAELEERSKNTTSAEEEFKANPLAYARKHGITMEQLIDMQLNDENPTVDMKLDRRLGEFEKKAQTRIEELEAKLQAAEAAQLEKEQKAAKDIEDRAINNFKSEITKHITGNDEFELIQFYQQEDLVYQVVEDFYAANGKILSIEDACRATEKHLEGEARKVQELKRFKQPAQKQKSENGKEAAPTLSNAMATEAVKSGSELLSREESLKRAAKMIKWVE